MSFTPDPRHRSVAGQSRGSRIPRRAALSAAAGAAAVVFSPRLARADAAANPGGSRLEQGEDATGIRYTTRGNNVNGEIALEEEGSEGISSVTGYAAWATQPPMRLRISRAEPDNSGAQHFILTPYQYGMAVDYPGVLECWVTDFSINGRGVTGARLWVGNHDDSGGLLITSVAKGGELYSDLTPQRFSGQSGGDLRFTIRDPNDSFAFRSGPAGAETTTLKVTANGQLIARNDSELQVTLGAVSSTGRPGISFGKDAKASLYAGADGTLRTESVFVPGGLGFANARQARQLGRLRATVEVFDAQGQPLGVMPIYRRT